MLKAKAARRLTEDFGVRVYYKSMGAERGYWIRDGQFLGETIAAARGTLYYATNPLLLDPSARACQQSISRARQIMAMERSSWEPVFADVFIDGHRVGHVKVDGDTHTTISFHPDRVAARGRHRISRKFPSSGKVSPWLVIPRWLPIDQIRFGEFMTAKELESL